eukprot:scaffold106457_cov28-Tisochrysis_lutea.AAC.1
MAGGPCDMGKKTPPLPASLFCLSSALEWAFIRLCRHIMSCLLLKGSRLAAFTHTHPGGGAKGKEGRTSRPSPSLSPGLSPRHAPPDTCAARLGLHPPGEYDISS